MKRKTKKYSIGYWINCVVLLLLSVTMIYPLVYTLSMSFSTALAASKSGFHLFPSEVSLLSYRIVLSSDNILVGYFNTIFRTVVGVVCSVLVNSAAAYALSRRSLPHRKGLSMFITATMLFSAGTVPMYMFIRTIHLINSRWVYILPTMAGAYNIIIMRSFMRCDIPESLIESAKIDGAREFTVFWKLILPLSKPIIATVALWSAVSHWNTWLDCMLYITDNSKRVLAFVLQTVIKENQTGGMASSVTLMSTETMDYTTQTIQSATIIVTILPILLVYPFVQKYFVKGIMVGAVKG